MAKRQKKPEEEGNGEAWLLPYSDLMTLLLAVFVVLFAVSSVDQGKADSMAQSWLGMMHGSNGIFLSGGSSEFQVNKGFIDQGAGNSGSDAASASSVTSSSGGGTYTVTSEGGTVYEVSSSGVRVISEGKGSSSGSGKSGSSGSSEGMQGGNAPTPGPTDNGNQSAESEGNSEVDVQQFLGDDEFYQMARLHVELQHLFENSKLKGKATSVIDKRGLVVSLNSAILFDSGSAEIKPENARTLAHLGKILKRVNKGIRIEGHTDNVPIHSAVYPSNWELSAARASSIVKLFIDNDKISPDKLVAVGYGEYRPVADNSTAEGRSKNRRVDIIVLSEKYDNLEVGMQ
ncbi:MAG: OmpA family protein [Lachnospiraceae bacterium]|jgi:chemotaxis protein MotB|nr:OmpA family protein [Lachnospiraceae bacterium]MEE3460877.1 OmpA family protein [Lachnospiraceae bacterium]